MAIIRSRFASGEWIGPLDLGQRIPVARFAVAGRFADGVPHLAGERRAGARPGRLQRLIDGAGEVGKRPRGTAPAVDDLLHPGRPACCRRRRGGSSVAVNAIPIAIVFSMPIISCDLPHPRSTGDAKHAACRARRARTCTLARYRRAGVLTLPGGLRRWPTRLGRGAGKRPIVLAGTSAAIGASRLHEERRAVK